MIWSRNPNHHPWWSVLYSKPDDPSWGWAPSVSPGLALHALLCSSKAHVHPLQHFSCVCCLTTCLWSQWDHSHAAACRGVVALLPHDAAYVSVHALQRGSCPNWLPRRDVRPFPMMLLTKSWRSFRVCCMFLEEPHVNLVLENPSFMGFSLMHLCPFVLFLVSPLFLYLLP